MSDMFDAQDDMGYWENMGQDDNVATAEAPEVEADEPITDPTIDTPEAEPEKEEPEARERDEKGRFVAKEETPAETTETPELIGGKFKSVDALLDAYHHAERRLGEKDNEVGDLRRLIEERLPEPEEPSYDPEGVQSYFDENPTKIPQIAAAAYQQGRPDLMAQALVAWSDLDPTGAEQFRLDVARQEAVKAVYDQDSQAQQTSQAYHTAAESFSKQHPDFDNYAQTMRDIAPEYPYIARLLETGEPKAVTEVLSFLYREARDRESANLASQAQQITADTAVEAAEAADRAIADAQVASASTVQQDPPPQTMADRIGDEWEAVTKPHTEGWNI